ncbi:MAG: hypothetical protein PUD66_03935, partial [Oscillospiraceae bacterium]|nr:hypothetical protein [Oscillospiraceae bacterium]
SPPIIHIKHLEVAILWLIKKDVIKVMAASLSVPMEHGLLEFESALLLKVSRRSKPSTENQNER